MKKKILSCLLAAVILAGFFVLPASATNEVLEIVATDVGPSAVWKGDLPGPSTDYWYYFYDNNLNSVPWIEYEIEAASTGSYHVDFAWGGTTKAKILVNGSEASFRTSSKAGETYETTRKWAKWQSCEMPVPLYAGKNTVRVELIPGSYNNNYWHAGVAAIKFTKTDDTPVLGTTTKAMSEATTNIPGYTFPCDPWVYANITDLNDPLYIKWNVNFPKTGYYKARVGAKSSSVATISVGNQTATMSNMIQLDTYCMPNTSAIGQKAPWYESGDIMYIEKGVHEVTYQMSPDAKIDNQYKIKVAGFQFAEVDSPAAHSDSFSINPLSPSKSEGAKVSDGNIVLGSANWADYDVYVTEDASYYVSYNGADPLYTQITANDETINFRTGRTKDSDGGFTFRDEIQLKEGKNTVRLSGVGTHSVSLSGLSFTKLSKKQYTTSMNTTQGGRTFNASYKADLGVAPWLWIGDSVADFPEENPPYVTLTVTIPKDGYYFPMIATSGANNVKLSIAGTDFAINDNCTVSDEPYTAGATDSASCSWLESNEGILLKSGSYDVTLSLYNPKGESWNSFIGAIRFIEGTEPVINDGSFTVDITAPQKVNGAKISGESVLFDPNQWAEYAVYVAEDASYYVNFSRANAVENKSFYIEVTGNGKTINRRTGRIQNADGSYTFCDELQLKQGKNIIKVAAMGNNSGILSGLSFTKLYTKQYTTSMNTAQGGRTFKEAYKDNLGVDPWLWINDPVTDYPDGNTAPYIAFEVTIPENGYYYPAIATTGDDSLIFNIADYSISFNENCTVLPEVYQASGNADAKTVMLRTNERIYLEEGQYDVKIFLTNPASEKWNTFIGAVRFISYTSLGLAITGTAADDSGVVTVDYTSPEDTDFYLIAASYTDGLLKGVDTVFVPAVNAPGRAALNAGNGTDYKLFVWDSLINIKPLLPKINISK